MKFNYHKYLPAFFAGVFFISSLSISIYEINKSHDAGLFSFLSVFYLLFPLSLGALFVLWKKGDLTIKNFFLYTLGSEIVLLVSTQIFSNMHYIFNMLSGAWILALGYYLIIKRHKKRNKEEKSEKKAILSVAKKTKKSSYILVSTLLAVIILIHFFFGIFNLDKETYSDERLWTYGSENRIEDYWKNIFSREWSKTRPSDKPGITLAIISGIGLFWESPSAYFDNIEDKEALLHMLFVMRLPVVIFGTLMLGIFFWIIKRLTETKTALAATAFIALSPILVGISHIINPDALIYIFIPLSLFCYLIYEKENKLFWLYLAGLFLGLGLLTKYISNLLVIFFFLSIFTNFVLREKNDQKIASFMREKLLDYATLIFIAVSVFYLLYPGTWMRLDRILLGTIWSQPFEPIWKLFLLIIVAVVADLVFLKSRVIGWLLEQKRKFRFFIFLFVPTIFLLASVFAFWNTYQNMFLIDFQAGLSSPKSFWRDDPFGTVQTFLSGFYALFFAISPLATLGLFTGLILTIWSIIKKQNLWRVIIFWQIILFCLIYYAGSAFSLVGPIIRYQIVIYPLALMLSGIGIIWLLEILTKCFFSKQQKFKKTFVWSAISLIIVFQTLALWNIKPYFFSYNSYLLPEPYLVNPKDMGDGNYKVAEFLNALPNAENLKIWSDNNGICVLFVGKCVNTISRAAFVENGPDFDYYVISNGRKERSTHNIRVVLVENANYDFRLDRLYEAHDFLLEITPGKRAENYIRIIKGDAVVVFEGEKE
jgi:4-amino-4-deoxy-L-arabinose transferase-like glycosyltransferase